MVNASPKTDPPTTPSRQTNHQIPLSHLRHISSLVTLPLVIVTCVKILDVLSSIALSRSSSLAIKTSLFPIISNRKVRSKVHF